MYEYQVKFFDAKERYGHFRGPTPEEVDSLLVSAPHFSRRDGDAYVYAPPGTDPAWPARVHVVSEGIWLTLPDPLRAGGSPFDATFHHLVHVILDNWGGLEICDG